MTKVLVTGSDGQLGQCLKQAAPSFPALRFDFKTKEALDITRNGAVQEVLESGEYSHCINTAAYTDVAGAEQFPERAEKLNVTAVRNLAFSCREAGTTLVQVSTDYVFDGDKKSPYREDDPPNPINQYGRTKWKGEVAVRELLKDHYIIRTSWLYSEFGNNFVKKITKRMLGGEPVRVVEDQTGAPTSAVDLAHFLCRLVAEEPGRFGTYHYCNLGQTSWYGLAREIASLSGIPAKITAISSAESGASVRRPAYSVLDTERTRDVFGIGIPHWKKSLTKDYDRIFEAVKRGA